ncbi:hypothetical protein PR048_028326, partial [Dryococelus australis]
MIKLLLRSMLGRLSLGYKDFSTIICEVESMINSRPLTHSEYIEDLADDVQEEGETNSLCEVKTRSGRTVKVPMKSRHRRRVKDNSI